MTQPRYQLRQRAIVKADRAIHNQVKNPDNAEDYKCNRKAFQEIEPAGKTIE
jgi:hypothetical protein